MCYIFFCDILYSQRFWASCPCFTFSIFYSFIKFYNFFRFSIELSSTKTNSKFLKFRFWKLLIKPDKNFNKLKTVKQKDIKWGFNKYKILGKFVNLLIFQPSTISFLSKYIHPIPVSYKGNSFISYKFSFQIFFQNYRKSFGQFVF